MPVARALFKGCQLGYSLLHTALTNKREGGTGGEDRMQTVNGNGVRFQKSWDDCYARCPCQPPMRGLTGGGRADSSVNHKPPNAARFCASRSGSKAHLRLGRCSPPPGAGRRVGRPAAPPSQALDGRTRFRQGVRSVHGSERARSALLDQQRLGPPPADLHRRPAAHPSVSSSLPIVADCCSSTAGLPCAVACHGTKNTLPVLVNPLAQTPHLCSSPVAFCRQRRRAGRRPASPTSCLRKAR